MYNFSEKIELKVISIIGHVTNLGAVVKLHSIQYLENNIYKYIAWSIFVPRLFVLKYSNFVVTT